MDYLSPRRQRELVARVRSGDSGAFGVLYEHFQLAITGHIAGRLANPEDIEDVAGDCFLLALKALKKGKFDPQYSFYTFLRAIADNEVKRLLKREYVKVSRRGDEAPRYVPKILVIPDEPSAAKEAWWRADQILANLAPDDAGAVASELLRLVLSSPAKPHQNLAFCLVRFLEWRPREVVGELGSSTLLQVTHRVYESFAVLFPGEEFAEDCREQHCPGFWSRLEERVCDVYPEPEYERLRIAPGGRTRDLVLEALFGPNPGASLSDWCDKVRRRARKTAPGGMLKCG